MAQLRLQVEGRIFRDEKNREVTLRGINCAGDAKNPLVPDLPSHIPDRFFEGDDVSFVGRPFSKDEAHVHFARLKRYGYNTIRYIFTWEAIEHAGPGKYDEEWIQFTIEVLRLAKEYGFYIFMDPHQDVWSRFTGGSGAPMWTLYAVGLDPRAFAVTEAALVQNVWPDPTTFPKMIWATSYWRLACQVMFTLFFGGRDFAPKAIIDGQNIQEYLQGHFVRACKHLAQRIHEAGDIENEIVVGWESMNEPNKGLVGQSDLDVVDAEQKLRKGTSPTPWQAILLGSGRPCEVETWDVGGLGPYKSGTQLVDPKGQMAWLPSDHDDTQYGWSRDPGWKLGKCLWAQHGIWDPANDELLKKDHFANSPQDGKEINYEHFTNTYFMDFYRRFRNEIRSVHKDAIMFCQPPVLEIPPSIKGTKDDDPNMVYTPHFYDGITLMTKSWQVSTSPISCLGDANPVPRNRYWNIDVFGILRGKYLTPAFAIKIGETAIRNCIRDQLGAIRQEGLDYMGEHPCVFSEIGIPFDMNDKHAYKTGDYTSQILAMDANHFALESCGAAGFTLWTYVATNNHEWGDLWNGEDLSVYSVDDKSLPASLTPFQSGLKSASASTTSLDATNPSFSQARAAADSHATVDSTNVRDTLATPTISRTPSNATGGDLAGAGYRAAEAYVRPSPLRTAGRLLSHGFDLRGATFSLALRCDEGVAPATATADGNAPTEVFLPEFHFPPADLRVEVSSGRWSVATDDADNGMGLVQRLRWWHGAGEQNLRVFGVKRKLGGADASAEGEDDVGYLEQCGQTARCGVM